MLTIKPLDLNCLQDTQALINLLSDYALDPMGGGQALAESSKQNLVAQLKKRTDYVGWLALDNTKAVGLLNAFEGFSTFYAKPLLNIHDLTVQTAYRGKGIALKLMQTAEAYARTQGYCKLTLEVLDENIVAKNLYQKMGFEAYQLAETAGVAKFWEKPL